MKKWQTILTDTYGLDIRSLALFRMGLAILILVDLAIRAQDLKVFYTDAGLMPRYYLLESIIHPWYFSLHLAHGSWQVEALLFLLAAAFAVALLFGFHTRFVTIVSWLLLISLQARNPLILHAGDIAFRLMLFWSMFLPLGAAYSVDSALDTQEEKPPIRIFTPAAFAVLVQVALIYWFSAFHKTGDEWLKEGTAAYYALSLDQFTTAVGYFLLQFPEFLKWMTFGTILWEAIGPFFLFVPFYVGPVRTIAITLFISLHLGFAAGLDLGTFPWIDIVFLTALLPSWMWDKFQPMMDTPERENLRFYYDGDCGFCKKLILLIRTFFLLTHVQLIPAQSEERYLQEMEAHNSWVVVDHAGQSYYKFEALCLVFRLSPIFWPFAALFRLNPCAGIGKWLYEHVADNRSRFSRWIGNLKLRPNRIEVPRWANWFALFMLAYVIAWNIGTVQPQRDIPERFKWLGYLLMVNQKWDMFSPFPLKDDGWYVIPGKLRNGEEVNILHPDQPIPWEKPKDVAAMYPNERWRKYLLNLYLPITKEGTLLHFARSRCRDWNDASNTDRQHQLMTFKIYFMQETTQPDYQLVKPVQRLLWTHYCFDMPTQMESHKLK